MIRTKRGAVRRYTAIIRKARKALAGGLMYGMDWPTFRASFPEEWAEIQELRKRWPTLKD